MCVAAVGESDGEDAGEEGADSAKAGQGSVDPKGPNYGIADAGETENGDARSAKLDDLKLTLHRTFGYWFDFGADWFHQVQVEKIEQAIPTVTYPRVIKRKGKSPPQYCDEE